MKLLDDLSENQTHLLATFIGMIVLYIFVATPAEKNNPLALAILFAICSTLTGYAIIFAAIIIYGIVEFVMWIYESFQKEKR